MTTAGEQRLGIAIMRILIRPSLVFGRLPVDLLDVSRLIMKSMTGFVPVIRSDPRNTFCKSDLLTMGSTCLPTLHRAI